MPPSPKKARVESPKKKSLSEQTEFMNKECNELDKKIKKIKIDVEEKRGQLTRAFNKTKALEAEIEIKEKDYKDLDKKLGLSEKEMMENDAYMAQRADEASKELLEAYKGSDQVLETMDELRVLYDKLDRMLEQDCEEDKDVGTQTDDELTKVKLTPKENNEAMKHETKILRFENALGINQQQLSQFLLPVKREVKSDDEDEDKKDIKPIAFESKPVIKVKIEKTSDDEGGPSKSMSSLTNEVDDDVSSGSDNDSI